MTQSERIKFVVQRFHEVFQGRPSHIGQAPGRVDLMGSHTDYNQGYVMTMTIDKSTWLAAAPRDDRRVEVYSANLNTGGGFSLDDIRHDAEHAWTNYVRGMAQALHDADYKLTGFNGIIHSTIPIGSGLSSSAALEMAAAVMFRALGGWELDPVRMALLGQKAENSFVGMNCGILDQYSSAMGQAGNALLLDCRHLTSRDILLPPNMALVICDTRAPRELTGSEYDERRGQCEQGVELLKRYYPDIAALRDLDLARFAAHEKYLPPVVAKRCRFVIQENQRVLDMGQALANGDETLIHDLCKASYEGARNLYEIGAPAMEAMMQAMIGGPGVIGARQAGAGFGGCMVAFVHRDQVHQFSKHVEKAYGRNFGVTPKVYAVSPAPGAGPLQYDPVKV